MAAHLGEASAEQQALPAAAKASPRPAPELSADEQKWPANVPPFRWWEYVASAGMLAGGLTLLLAVDVSGEPTWTGGILLDEAVYDATFVDSKKRFQMWRTVGDVGYLSGFAWSGVDPLIAGIAYDWGTAWQMAMMNLEAASVYSLVLSVSQVVVRRERPATRECVDPAHAAELGCSCGRDNANVNRSFISGHTGTVATTATLTCIHHANLPLWGSPAADALPCVTWTAMTALVFTSRTITGQHYLSDNLLGVAVGTLSGFVPWFLHYAWPLWNPEVATWPVLPTSALVAPNGSGAGLHVGGLIL